MDINSPAVQQKVAGMQHSFMAKGMSAEAALGSAYKSLDYIVTKQANVLTYMDVFLYIGLMFLVCIPLMLLVRTKKQAKVDIGEAMH